MYNTIDALCALNYGYFVNALLDIS